MGEQGIWDQRGWATILLFDTSITSSPNLSLLPLEIESSLIPMYLSDPKGSMYDNFEKNCDFH